MWQLQTAFDSIFCVQDFRGLQVPSVQKVQYFFVWDLMRVWPPLNRGFLSWAEAKEALVNLDVLDLGDMRRLAENGSYFDASIRQINPPVGKSYIVFNFQINFLPVILLYTHLNHRFFFHNYHKNTILSQAICFIFFADTSWNCIPYDFVAQKKNFFPLISHFQQKVRTRSCIYPSTQPENFAMVLINFINFIRTYYLCPATIISFSVIRIV